MSKKRTQKTAQQIAAEGVAAFFADITSRLPVGEYDVDFDQLANEVERALAKAENAGAEHLEDGVFEQQAGYLIGVEVGRRLGGVR